MGHLSFRIKLLLALMTVVAGVTAVALWVTERQVAAAHARLFREHVSAQLKYLPREQEARLGVAREQSRAFADLDAVRAAVEEHDGAGLFRLARQQLEPMLDDAFADLAAQLEAERLHTQRLALTTESPPATPIATLPSCFLQGKQAASIITSRIQRHATEA